jgi:hypothetical protein
MLGEAAAAGMDAGSLRWAPRLVLLLLQQQHLHQAPGLCSLCCQHTVADPAQQRLLLLSAAWRILQGCGAAWVENGCWLCCLCCLHASGVWVCAALSGKR